MACRALVITDARHSFAKTSPMQYTNLGKTGLKVSRLCLGCMSYGVPERGTHVWTLSEEQSRPFIARAIELGINFFDTSNSYSDGTSEEITGRALRDFAKRDDVVIATKVFYPTRKDANAKGLSRKAIMTEIDGSLRRLGTDYIDLYQIHRWDYRTPIEETLEALHDVVKAGKARYLGASSMFAWQFCTALHVAERHGWTRFVSMQNHYNLLYREEEREMLGLCRSEGIGVIPWSPLARGKLTRPWEDSPSTERAATDEFGKTLYSHSATGRIRPSGHRARRHDCRCTRSAAGTGGAGLAAGSAGRHRADRRRNQTPTLGGRHRRSFADLVGRRAHRSRPAVCPPRRRRFRMSGGPQAAGKFNDRREENCRQISPICGGPRINTSKSARPPPFHLRVSAFICVLPIDSAIGVRVAVQTLDH